MIKDLVDTDDEYEPWTKSDMELMLELGYTPEYVSLTKWIVIHKHYIVTQDLNYAWLNGNTCALCDKYYNHMDSIDDDTSCGECTLYKHMGIVCNNDEHPYSDVRWGSIDDLIPNMVEIIKQLTILVAKHGVMIDEKTKQ